MSEAAGEVYMSHSVITTTLPHQPVDVGTLSDSVTSLPHQHVDVSSDVGTQSDSVTSLPQQRVDVSCDDVTSEVDPPQPVACPLELPSVASADVGTYVDVRTDNQHIRDDEADMGLDETVYHDCISTSFTSKLLFLVLNKRSDF